MLAPRAIRAVVLADDFLSGPFATSIFVVSVISILSSRSPFVAAGTTAAVATWLGVRSRVSATVAPTGKATGVVMAGALSF